jgi:hypothetical protein
MAASAAPMSQHARELERFDRLTADFARRLGAIRLLTEPAFVRGDWADRMDTLTAAVAPRPPWDFLHLDEIRFQMFVGERYLEHELPYVLERLPNPKLLQENAVGKPPVTRVAGGKLPTSSNTVHHAHHLLKYEDVTGRRLSASRCIVEWGAGYGNLAKLVLRLHAGAPTLVLIDLPVYSAIQWLYLSSVMGDRQVVLHERPPPTLVPGAVNIVPVGLARHLDVRADLFVSTWSLNESTRAAQDLVLDRAWFGADSLLLGMHRGDPFEPNVLAAGVTPVPIGPWIPGQHYFVR